MLTKWWQNEIVYQVYPRSFQDTNNDGIGDLKGVIAHLDYLQSLGVSMIWLSPIYQSPMVDMGYDISDYQAIDPQFGTMEDFDELLAQAKKRNIKLIMDLVINHTSDQHKWFQQALKDPKSPYRDYYIFKKTVDGKAPNNWRSIFGGSTWSEVEGEPGTYYFHTFAPQQPDLNWENPKLRQEIYQMVNWWLEKGIAGYRVDAITHLKKDLDWASLPADDTDGLVSVIKKGQNRPGLEVFLEELKRETFEKYDAVTIGEAYGVAQADLPKFIGPDGYFSMIFDFSYMNIEIKNVDEWYRGKADWSVTELKDILFASQKSIKDAGGFTANVLENHDQPRVLSKLIKNEKWQNKQAAKALATMYYFLPGIPFIYQGQEVGMKNCQRQSIEEFNDVSTLNNYQMALKAGICPKAALSLVNDRSRDNARTPMQWDESIYGGFSTVEPWLKMGTQRDKISVATQENDKTSILNYYRQLAKLRKQYQKFLEQADLTPITKTAANVVAYQRDLAKSLFTVLVNLDETSNEVELPKGKLILNNQEKVICKDHVLSLDPYQAMIFYYEK